MPTESTSTDSSTQLLPPQEKLPAPFMSWTPEMSVGIQVMDEDHKQLVSIINQLHDGILAGHKRDVLEYRRTTETIYRRHR